MRCLQSMQAAIQFLVCLLPLRTFWRWRKRRCACLLRSASTCLNDLPEPVLLGEPLLQPSSVERFGPLPPPLSALRSPLLWGEFPYSAQRRYLSLRL